jgi:S-adenosylmethionine/arginine decarboxylase-like enzyme
VGNGRHLILDLYDCDPEVLDDYQELQRLLETSLVMAKATILRIIGEKFKPQGVTHWHCWLNPTHLFIHGLAKGTVLLICTRVETEQKPIKLLNF